MGGVNGGAQTRGAALSRVIEGIVEVWRERASERRAVATPRHGSEPRIRRSRLGAALEARLAVRSGVRLDDFLRNRLAKYASRLPVPLEALPVTLEVEGGEAVVRARPAPPRRDSNAVRGEAPAFTRALVERDGLYAAREIRDAETALDALDARAVAARARLDALELEISEALAKRQIVAPPQLDATAEQLGRPPVPPASPIFALRAFVAALLAAEAWRFSGPVLSASGIAPDGLEEAARSAPVPTALVLAFAIGAAAAAFTFAGAAVSRMADSLSLAADPGRRRLLVAAAIGAGVLVPGVAAAAAAPDRWALVALLALVPFAGALMWRAADALARTRAKAAASALEWDRERAREAVERGRREEIRARAAAELAANEAERAMARRRLQQLHRAAIGAERNAEVAARFEARRLDRIAEGLACALELDRYLYLRLSGERPPAVVERPVRSKRLEPAVAGDRLGIAG